MKKIILISLIFSGLLFAQAQGSLVSALAGLCSTTKSLLSTFGTLCCIGGIFPLLIGAVLYYFKKENRILKIVGIVLLCLGVVAIVLSILYFVIYLITPYLIKALVGSGVTVVC